MPLVGILALQGGFAAHAAALRAARLNYRLVRTPRDLDDLDGLILPGGESPAQLRLAARHQLEQPLAQTQARGLPVLATCAGLILAARTVVPNQPSLGWLDIAVERNGWGRQQDSFEAESDDGRHLIFIRAPRIRAVGPAVEVLATYRGEAVLVRQGAVVGATFHPELHSGELHAALFTAPGSAQHLAQG